MDRLKFWQTILAVLWVSAFLGGGYFFYNSFFWGGSCSVHIQNGSKSCGGSGAGNIRQNDFLRYDITSPLGAVLQEKEKPGFPTQLK